MLDTKYVCKCTSVLGEQTSYETYKYIGNHEHFREECSHEKLFELLYDRPCTVGVTRPFKVELLSILCWRL